MQLLTAAAVLASLFAIVPGTLATPVAIRHAPPDLIVPDGSSVPKQGLANLGYGDRDIPVNILTPNIIMPHRDHEQSDEQEYKSGSSVTPTVLPSASSASPSSTLEVTLTPSASTKVKHPGLLTTLTSIPNYL